jgi:hypothetical protein
VGMKNTLKETVYDHDYYSGEEWTAPEIAEKLGSLAQMARGGMRWREVEFPGTDTDLPELARDVRRMFGTKCLLELPNGQVFTIWVTPGVACRFCRGGGCPGCDGRGRDVSETQDGG